MLSLYYEDLRQKALWYYNSDKTKNIFRVILTDGSFTMLIYRLMQWCYKHRLKPFAMILSRLNGFLSGALIGIGADFGPGFVIIHTFGTVINSSVIGGHNVFIEHGVTIGAEKGKSPILANDIFIGAGAKIIGEVNVGSNVKVGANAVVVHDIPDNSTAVGVPARVLKSK